MYKKSDKKIFSNGRLRQFYQSLAIELPEPCFFLERSDTCSLSVVKLEFLRVETAISLW